MSHMTLEQLQEIRGISAVKPSISVEELENKAPRTLLFGYDVDRNTYHVYLDESGDIVRVIYRLDDHIDTVRGQKLDIELLVPNKRVYPEATDFAFAKLLAEKDAYVSYTTYNSERKPAQFHGRRF